MKKIVLLSSAVVLLLASCKETDLPLIGGSKTLNDTTYVASVETPQAHNVLLEEFTGCSCSNCPAAHDVINSLLTSYGSQLIPIGIHPKSFPQGDPYPGSVYDFRTDKGTAIGTQIYGGIAGMPEGGIDRVVYGTSLQLTKDKWPSAIAARTSVASGINLYVSSHYNAAAATDTIAVTIAYTQANSSNQNINVAIVEDSLYDLQEDQNLVVDSNYLYTGVFRDLVTSVPSGDAILPAVSSKEAGRVVKLYYLYKVSTKVLFNPLHCRVVAFVTDASTGAIDVLQTTQAPFAGN